MQSNDENIDEEWERERAEEEADRLRKAEPPPKMSAEEFLSWRSPRAVGLNPTRLDNPLWQWLVRTRWDAYNANNLYSGPSPFDAGPMWTFQRFGKSETRLCDGRVVHIGGEHEDHYDPDFFIYNDVTVIDPAGNIAIYGYPVQDFPPTDFHTATLVGEEVFIIGSLGYPERRVVGATPVYKLLLASMRIQPIATYGEPPGWIYRHTAALADDGRSIIVSGGERWLGNDWATSENIDSWAFDTQSGEWRRLTEHKWQRWTMRRVDRRPNRLWEIRQALWHRDHAHLGLENHWAFSHAPDFAALARLYRLSDDAPPPTEGPNFNVFTVVIDGLRVRFREERSWVEAVVEGQLTPERLFALKRTTLALLERLEAAPWEIEVRDGSDGQA
jgi:hypothetical protein